MLPLVVALVVVAAACGEPSPVEPPAAAPPESLPPVTSSTVPEDGGVPGDGYRWSTLPIGAGGWATGITLHPGVPGTVHVRTDGSGAYRYVEDDQRWEQMLSVAGHPGGAHEPADYVVESIAVAPSDPSVIYLLVGDDPLPVAGDESTGRGRLLRSADGGRSWTASPQRWLVSGNADFRQRSERLAVDPLDPDRVIVGTRRDGLWRSADGGASWDRIVEVPIGRDGDPDPYSAGVSFVTWAGEDDSDRVWAGVAGVGVFASLDRGDTWRLVRSIDEPSIAPFDGVVADGRLFVSFNRLDDQASARLEYLDIRLDRWVDITPPSETPVWSVAVMPQDANRLVAADRSVRDGHLWRTIDGGSLWAVADIEIRSPDIPWLEASNLDEWMSVGRLAFDPHHAGRLWFAEGMGVWTAERVFSSDPVTWTSRSRGLEQTVLADVVAPPGGRPISVVADRQGFLHQDLAEYPGRPLVDERFASGTDIDYSAEHPEVMVWVGAEHHLYLDPRRRARGAVSRDQGRTWSELPNLVPDQFGGNVAVSATDPDNFVWVPSYYLGPFEFEDQPRGVFVTDDAGQTWTELPGIDGSHRFHRLMWWFARRALAADRVIGGTFYLNDDEGRFLVSSNGGFDWERAEHAPPCSVNTDCHVYGQLRASPVVAGEVWASTGTAGLFRTTDQGRTPWTPLPGVVEARAFDFGAPVPGSDHPAIFLHGRVGDDPDLGLWRSSDGGASWDLIGRYPAGIYRRISVVTGDPDRPGRVHLGFGGLGSVYGDDPTLVAADG